MLHEAFGPTGSTGRFTSAFAGNQSLMKDALTSAMQSRAGRAAALVVAAVLFTFLAGYVLFGPLALRLLPR
jgi:tetrahydromethanopterin S-methyltransferase subunit E